ncbi:hypothetical protein LIA77_07294 [Sarocladium implicatum]|nr:hypothetical protein LIA77_07294 [Sarocladium implicatum]
MADSTSQSYRGNCHCGAFIYMLTTPTPIVKVDSCDCSFCSKTGALWHPVPDNEPATQLSFVKGSEDDLHVYNYPGKAIGEAYQTPTYEGPEPAAEIENAEIYNGSCHCGNVKLAFKSEPFTEDTQVRECNCSICTRNGYLWMYPMKNQVVITTDPSDALTSYAHASGVFPKTFCANCACQIQNSARELSREELDEFGSDYEEFYNKYKAFELLNVRLLNGVDFGTLKREKFKGAGIPPVYVNP